MKASELIRELQKAIEAEGDLDVTYPSGEMGDPASVGDVTPTNMDNLNEPDDYPLYVIPWDKAQICNTKAFHLT